MSHLGLFRVFPPGPHVCGEGENRHPTSVHSVPVLWGVQRTEASTGLLGHGPGYPGLEGSFRPDYLGPEC